MFQFIFGLIFGAFFAMLYEIMYGKENKALEAGKRSLTAALQPSSYAAASAVDRSGSFLTDIIASIWSQVNVAVSTEVKNTVEPMFKDMLPGPLKTLHFTKLSLGDVPLRLDNCIVHECKTNLLGKKYVQIEIDVVWDGQCDIQLKADYVGKLGVQSLKLAGRLSLLLQPIIDTIPVVGAVQYGFVNPPTLEMDFTGVANVADVSSVKSTINTTIADILNGMLVLPNRMMTKLDDKVSFFSAYQPPLGVARISILRGRGFKVEERSLRSNDIPDVYCTVTISATPVWTTSVVQNSLEPEWTGETADTLLDDYNQIITISAFDKDDGTMDSDDPLGSAQITVGEILLAGNMKELELQDQGGRGSGAFVTVHCELLNLVADARSMEGKTNQDKKKKFNGLLTILVSQASDLPKRSDPEVPEMYFAKATYGAQNFYTSAADGQIPVYDRYFRVPLIETEKCPVTLSLYKGVNASDTGKDNVLVGTFSISYDSILDNTACTLSSRHKVCEDGPSLEYSVSVCGLAQAKQGTEVGLAKASAVVSPASGPDKGTPVDVTIEKGWGFKAESRGLLKADVPDTYVKLTFGSSPRVWRTKTIKNSFTPFWQETQQFEMRDHSQIINIEAWDEDTGSNDVDDLLGSARISVGKILLAGGSFDVELLQGGKPSGIYVTIRCGLSAGETKAEAKNSSQATDEAGPSIPSAANTADTTSNNETASSVSPAVVVSPETTKTGTTHNALQLSTHLIRLTEVVDPPRKLEPSEVTFCLTAVKGSGFQVEKRRFGKGDIPDVYCKITVGGITWQTKTIKNDVAPAWNESKSFCVDNDKAEIQIKVYDEDDGIADKDDLLGVASLPVGTLLSSGTKDLDLLSKDGSPTGYFITLKCSSE